jgi:hypothetical protein
VARCAERCELEHCDEVTHDKNQIDTEGTWEGANLSTRVSSGSGASQGLALTDSEHDYVLPFASDETKCVRKA